MSITNRIKNLSPGGHKLMVLLDSFAKGTDSTQQFIGVYLVKGLIAGDSLDTKYPIMVQHGITKEAIEEVSVQLD